MKKAYTYIQYNYTRKFLFCLLKKEDWHINLFFI